MNETQDVTPTTTVVYVPPPVWKHFSTWLADFAAFLFALPVDWVSLDITNLDWHKVFAAVVFVALHYAAKKAKQGELVVVQDKP
jgi:hypothetical protein